MEFTNKQKESYKIQLSLESNINQPVTHVQTNTEEVYFDYSFENFIKKYQDANNNLNSSWNKSKENFLREQKDRKRIIMKEMTQFDFKDPFKILDDSYLKDVYNTNLLANEVKSLDSIFSDVSFSAIVDKKGNLEMIKKIIEYYLNYVVEINFDSIMRALKKLNLIEVNLEMSYTKVVQSKQKLTQVKEKVLMSSAKFLLMKQKLKNLYLLHSLVKTKLSKWQSLFVQSKKLKANNKFCNLWMNMNLIRTEVLEWVSNCNSDESQKKTNLFKKRSLIINDILLQKSKDKLNKLQSHVEKQINDLFYNRKDNILECFNYFMLNPTYTGEKFLEVVETVFNKTVFSVIKGSMASFTDDSKSFIIQDIHKIRDISKLKFEENKFVQALHHMIKNFTKICENYVHMVQICKPNTELSKLLSVKNATFYEKAEKKYTKVLRCFTNLIREFNSKNMIYLTVYNCLFLELIKYHFKVDYSKYLILQTKTIVLESVKFKNIQNIKKIGILLGGDNWKRAALQNYNEFFSQDKFNEKIPLFIRNFLTIFNDVSYFVNKSNIKEVFDKYIEVFSISNNNKMQLTDELKFEMLSKSLNNKTIILSSSTITLVKYIVDLVIDLAYFDSITYELFTQIFNLVDYYFLAALKMFGDKKNLSQLFEDINIEDVKKKNKYESAIDLMLFQKKLSHLRKYLISTKKNLEILFEVEIDLQKSSYDSSDNYESGEFYLPKLNSQIIINDNNIYSCMIESIILYESMISVRKIVKRISHFSKKIELDFQSNLILDHIKKYEIILEEIKFYFFKPICQNIFKIDPIMNKIINYKWDPKDTELDQEFSEANVFIDNLFQEICEKYEKLDLLSAGSLTEKSKMRFLEIIVIHIIEKLTDAFSRIKKCNSSGRSIMLKDIKFFKSKLEHKFNREFHSFFGELELYINSWYCSEDEFLKYVEDTHLNYKFLNGIINTGQNFTKLTRQQRKDFNTRLDETYLTVLENIKVSMLD